MNRFFNGRRRSVATLAATTALAVTGFYGLHAATAEHNPPATIKTAPRSEAQEHRGYSGIVKKVTPAVVNISSSRVIKQTSMRGQRGQGDDEMFGQQFGQLDPFFRQFFGNNFGNGMNIPRERREKALGSGVIVAPEGYILTNNHVVDHASEVTVTLSDKRDFKARVIGTDPRTDIAVLKIDGGPFPSLMLGDSSKVEVGDVVLAIGDPFGVGQTVTAGIVSATGRSLNGQIEEVEDFIQTDAPINPGNSGGALVDAHGELIGINTFIITNSGSFAGAGFAIPSQIARSVTESLIKNGTVHHGYLGISMNDVTPDNYNFFKLKEATGAIISQVTPDSPAARAGLKAGDVIDSLNGTKIPNGSALQVAVSEISPGTSISLGIIRNGEPQTVEVKVGEFHGSQQIASADDNSGVPGKTGKLGLAVQDLTQDVRQQMQIPARVDGAVVANVRPGSPADDAGLAPGDVILEVNRQPVSNAQQFVNDVHANPGKDVLLLVWSHGNATYRVLHPDNNSDSQNGM